MIFPAFSAILGLMVKLSRSKLELFLGCPRCFWLEMTQGIKRPQPPPYTINNAVDYLLKQEFDTYRESGTPHPVMKKYKVDAIPYKHEKINTWRQNFTGVQYQHEPTGFLVYGAIDDVWINPGGELMVVDYKATGAKQHQIYDSYKRQIEIYQWLLRHNDFVVSPTGYFVFARVSKAGGFGMGEALRPGSGQALRHGSGQAALSFDMFVESYSGDDTWVEPALFGARETFDLKKSPTAASDCEYCRYGKNAANF